MSQSTSSCSPSSLSSSSSSPSSSSSSSSLPSSTPTPYQEIRFQRHDPVFASISFSPYALMIIGEPGRRGGQRTVIAEDATGARTTLATWNPTLGSDGFGRWVVVYGDGAGFVAEDVRAVLMSSEETTP